MAHGPWNEHGAWKKTQYGKVTWKNASNFEMASHQAIHDGGNCHLGRTCPGEMIMKVLRKAKTEAGRILTRNEILNIVAERMNEYNLPMTFTPGKGNERRTYLAGQLEGPPV